MEDLYVDNCFLVVLLYRDLKENILGGGDSSFLQIPFFQWFCFCFLWIVRTLLSNLQVSNLHPEWIRRGGRNLWVQDVSLTYPTFQSDALFLYSKGPVASTSRASAAQLICKSVPLLPEIRRSRTFEHKFNLPLRASQVTQLLKKIHLQCRRPWFNSWSGRSAGEGIDYPFQYSWASRVTQLVKNPPAMQETWVSHHPL